MHRRRRNDPHRPDRLSRSLRLESLESRRMLSGDPVMLTDGWAADSLPSNPHSFTQSGGVTYFVAKGDESQHYEELWRTDGSAAGTRMVVDLSPGLGGGGGSTPRNLTDVDGVLYFTTTTVNGAVNGFWKTDGTPAGTTRVADAAGNVLFSTHELVEMNDVWYFVGSTANSNYELWRTDGTSAGTWQVKEIRPGSDSAFNVPIEAKAENLFHVVGDTLYFVGDDGSRGRELWMSDGTDAGTAIVKDIDVNGNVFIWTDGPSYAHIGDVMYYAAGAEAEGTELYRTDGTEAGTYLVKDILPGSAYSRPKQFTAVGDKVYFLALLNGAPDTSNYTLWVTDGTTAGTQRVSTSISYADSLTAIGNELFLSVGTRLFRSDGTAAGTVMVQAVHEITGSSLVALHLPGSSTSNNLAVGDFAVADGKLYFSASMATPYSDLSLWEYVPGAVGATRVQPRVGLTSPHTDVANLTAIGDKLYFAARPSSSSAGHEPFISDRTAAGTLPLKDLTGVEVPSYTVAMGELNGEFLYSRLSDLTHSSTTFSEVRYLELWLSDGALSGSRKIATLASYNNNFFPSNGISVVARAGDFCFFQFKTLSNQSQLWRTDGTAEGTLLLKSIEAIGDSTGMFENTSAELNGVAYFFAKTTLNGRELWRSDGTVDGTHMVADLASGMGGVPDLVQPSMIVNDGVLYFTAGEGPSQGLWRTDGTAGGTSLVKAFSGVGNYPAHLTVMNGVLYFSANVTGAAALWRSDGTEAGTTIVKAWEAGSGLVSAFQSNFVRSLSFAVLNGEIYFAADDGVHGVELWKSDGTEAGTVLVDDIRPAGDALTPGYFSMMTAFNGAVYFAANSDGGGYRLWRTDGTAGGTTAVEAADSSALRFGITEGVRGVELDGVLYFYARHQGQGSHAFLARTNGTDGGTYFVNSSLPVVQSSPPFYGPYVGLDVVDGSLFFIEGAQPHGFELWSLQRDPAPVAVADYDRDGDADGADFLAWQRAVGTRDGWIDSDDSGYVDAGDLDAWRDNFGAVAGLVASATAAAVEPTALSNDAQAALYDELFAAGDFSQLFTADEDPWQRWRRIKGVRTH